MIQEISVRFTDDAMTVQLADGREVSVPDRIGYEVITTIGLSKMPSDPHDVWVAEFFEKAVLSQLFLGPLGIWSVRGIRSSPPQFSKHSVRSHT